MVKRDVKLKRKPYKMQLRRLQAELCFGQKDRLCRGDRPVASGYAPRRNQIRTSIEYCWLSR